MSYASVTLAQLTLNDDDDGAPLGGEGSTKPLEQNKIIISIEIHSAENSETTCLC